MPFVASLPHAYSLRRTSLPHDLVAEHAARTPASRDRQEGKEHHTLSEALSRTSLSRPKGSGPRTDWAEELTTLAGSHKVSCACGDAKGPPLLVTLVPAALLQTSMP